MRRGTSINAAQGIAALVIAALVIAAQNPAAQSKVPLSRRLAAVK